MIRMVLYSFSGLFFCLLGGGNNPKPDKGRHTGHSPLGLITKSSESLFPFHGCQRRKSRAKAVTHPALSKGGWSSSCSQNPTGTHRAQGGPSPSQTAAPKLIQTTGQRVQHLRSSFHSQPLGASSGFCICTRQGEWDRMLATALPAGQET